MNPDFNKFQDGLIPAIVQDVKTKSVLMLGYMNEDAYQKTLEDRKVCFYSRSKQRLWVKGETSGNFLQLKEIKLDCDQDAFLVLVAPKGPVCHKGTDTCWAEKNEHAHFIHTLDEIIEERVANEDPKSYTVSLIKKGINKVAQKVGEEGVEVVIEATNGTEDRLIEESADLMYHLLVLLRAKNVSFERISDCLKNRHQPQ